MNSEIEHKGIVFDIVDKRVDVTILSESACASCKVKGVCSMSESKDKVISVFADNPSLYSVGDQVTVSVHKSMGMKAVLLAYVLPLILVLGLLIILLEIGFGEVEAGLTALASLAVYYIMLYFFRGKLEKEIIFKIKK